MRLNQLQISFKHLLHFVQKKFFGWNAREIFVGMSRHDYHSMREKTLELRQYKNSNKLSKGVDFGAVNKTGNEIMCEWVECSYHHYEEISRSSSRVAFSWIFEINPIEYLVGPWSWDTYQRTLMLCETSNKPNDTITNRRLQLDLSSVRSRHRINRRLSRTKVATIAFECLHLITLKKPLRKWHFIICYKQCLVGYWVQRWKWIT